MNQLLIPTNKGLKPVLEQNIIRVEASSNYCKIFFMNEQPLVVAKILLWFEEQLPVDMFCRIHRTHLVNRLYITDVTEKLKITLINGDMVQISRRKKDLYKNISIQST
jgi:two-component system, LytTR family, response regulator